MALITVRFYSLWRLRTGTGSVTLQADNVDEALAQLEEKFGSQLRGNLEADGIHLAGKIQDHSLILLNGIALHNLKSTHLKEGDVLYMFPPVAGG